MMRKVMRKKVILLLNQNKTQKKLTVLKKQLLMVKKVVKSGNEFTATTDTSYNNKFNEVRDINAKDRDYSFIPKVKLDKVIISSDEIFKLCRENYKSVKVSINYS